MNILYYIINNSKISNFDRLINYFYYTLNINLIYHIWKL